jgi:hypothetical protein
MRRSGSFTSDVAARTLSEVCDNLVFSTDALPLPPLKFDEKINNVNLQIAAAKAGLRHVERQFVLRIRNDAVFYDAGFIDFYLENNRQKRGGKTYLQDRVLICDTYTLNPYSFERLPYHFSDWFHFGSTADVREIWQCPPMNYADSIYYEFQSHKKDSFFGERLFRSRLAAEQHIISHWAHGKDPENSLLYHNDLQSRDLSLQVLRDNFIISDRLKCKLRMRKYANARVAAAHKYLCVSHADWARLAADPARKRFDEWFGRMETAAKRINWVRSLRAFRAARSIQRRIAAALRPKDIGTR